VPTISLPTHSRRLEPYTTGDPLDLPPRGSLPVFNRVAYAAAHVVADPLADINPWLDAAIDWERTIAFRHYLWDLGLGVAEAMDTAQRGMGLDWAGARELIRRTLEAAQARPGALISCGVGTDHLQASDDITLDDVVRAYEEQIEAIERMGGKLIVMASRALAQVAKGPEDYAKVYDRILTQARQPVILHWLGEMFDPALGGYWGATDHMKAMETCLAIVSDNRAKVNGIKISLLSKEKEIAMRRRLPGGVQMYTGDDFNYVELIAGDGEGYSDALLGIFDAIAPAASAGLARLAVGDRRGFEGILEPTAPLSRHIFKHPTRFYKTGVVFLAWLNGLQDQFIMVGGQESARSLQHLAELFRLADKARVLRDPELAASRISKLMAVHGLS
jgi:hypothetical protein